MLRCVAMNIVCRKISKNLIRGDFYKHSKGGKMYENARWKHLLKINLRVCNMSTSN
jgi:hypothetical protein